MARKIGVREFFSVLGRGVWSGVCWVFGMFGIKDGSSLGRFAKRLFMISLAVITFMIALAFSIEVIDNTVRICHRRFGNEYEVYMSTYPLGDSYGYRTDRVHPGYVKDMRTGKRVLEDLIWLQQPEAGDSLAIFKTRDDHRGYFNIYTGEVLQPVYDKGWIFSEGVAAVMKDGKVFFIDNKGNRVFDKSFGFSRKIDGYVFHGDLCPMVSEHGGVGLINRKGEWTLTPDFDNITGVESGKKNWWIVSAEGKAGVLDGSLAWVLPLEYSDIVISDDNESIYASHDGVRKRYDLTGKVLDEFIITDTGTLEYVVEEGFDGVEIPDYKPIKCMTYSISSNRMGLLSAEGRPLTKALYTHIRALTPSLFLAEIENGESVLLDDKGNIIK